jgi:hypothetical protein
VIPAVPGNKTSKFSNDLKLGGKIDCQYATPLKNLQIAGAVAAIAPEPIDSLFHPPASG